MVARSCSSRRPPKPARSVDGGCQRSPDRQLVPSVTAAQVVVTPDDRSVLYTSLAGGTGVDLDGAARRRHADEARRRRQRGRVAGRGIDGIHGAGPADASVVVCSLPGCTSPRPIGSVKIRRGHRWTPDGRGVAYSSEGNLWVQALSGGAPRQLTRFTDTRPIGSFAWSRDGKRLAITRVTVPTTSSSSKV